LTYSRIAAVKLIVVVAGAVVAVAAGIFATILVTDDSDAATIAQPSLDRLNLPTRKRLASATRRVAARPSYDQVKTWAEAYKAAHPGNGGKNWDINAKTPARLASDRAAARLVSICGADQRPVIPIIAWEYGGMDHQWINPSASALVYCVYTPVHKATPHWRYDAAATRVTADVYVKYPHQNPCRTKTGRDQVARCIGDVTNFEILVDTASLHDGAGAGLNLAGASTELRLIMPDGRKVQLVLNT
jgi:hypothetical protein